MEPKRARRLLLAISLIAAVASGIAAAPSQAATSTFTGSVSASGSSWRAFSFSVPTAGTITATLSWTTSSAKLNLFLRDPSSTQVAANTTTSNPKTITYEATATGTWSAGVKAATGDSDFTLRIDTAGDGVSAPQYAATIGGPGHAEMYPSGLDVDPANGIVYVADTGNDQIKAYDSLGNRLWEVGTRGLNPKLAGRFGNPRDVAYANGKLYVADTGNNRIQVATLGADRTLPPSTWTPWSYRFTSIIGITAGVNASGAAVVLAADEAKHIVQLFNPASPDSPTRTFGSGTAGNEPGQLNAPRDAATDSNGNVYVADYRNSRIVKFAPTGNQIATWGSKGTSPGQLNHPYGIAVDAQDQVYVADGDNGRIQKFSATTTGDTPSPLRIWGTQGSGSTKFLGLRRVAVGGGTNPAVYGADLWGYKLLRFPQANFSYPAGAASTDSDRSFPKPGGAYNYEPVPGYFNEPYGVAVDDANTFVMNTDSQRIEGFDTTSAPTFTFDPANSWGDRGWGGEDNPGFNWARDVTIDGVDNNVWVADTKNNRLLKFDRGGKQLAVTGGGSLGPSLGRLDWPHALASYPTTVGGGARNDLIVANTQMHRIERWNTSAACTVFLNVLKNDCSAQIVWAATVADGRNFKSPKDLAVSGDTIYVADTLNKRVVTLNAADGRYGGLTIENFAVGTRADTLHAVEGVAVEPSGNIWVADSSYNRLIQFAPDGTFVQLFGKHGKTGHGVFNKPTHLEVRTISGGQTLLFVVDSWNDRVEVFTISGSTSPPPPPPPPPPPDPSEVGYKATYGFSGPAGTYPYGMAWDATDNTLVVGDFWNYRVKRFDAKGVPCGNHGAACAAGSKHIVSRIAPRSTVSCTSGPPTCGGIGSPFGLAADPGGNVWVGDQSNSRIVQFDHNGNWLKTIGSGGGPESWQNYPKGCGGKMTIPTHLVVDPANSRVYVTDPQCRSAYAFSNDGRFLFQFAFDTSAIGVSQVIPRGVDVDDAGNIYIVDFNSRRIVVFNRNGSQIGMSEKFTQMNDPRGLVVDRPRNRIYVTAGFYNEVYRFSIGAGSPPAITYSTVWNSPSGQQLTNDRQPSLASYRPSCGAPTAVYPDCRFDSVRWSTVDGDGNIYVGDTWGYRVWKFAPDLGAPAEPLEVPAGTCSYPYTGACMNAGHRQAPPAGGFNQNNGIAVSSSGAGPNGKTTLYVVDTFDNRAQMFDTATSCPANGNCPAYLGEFGSRRSVTPQSDGFEYPVAAAFGGGTLWTGGTNAVINWSPGGVFLPPRYGSHGKGVGQFSNGPRGLAAVADPNGGTILYTTDSGSCRLQKLHTTNTKPFLSVMSPSFGVAGCGNSQPAQLKSPQQVAVNDSQTRVYVADFYNNRVAIFDGTSGGLIRAVTGPFGGKALSQPGGVAIDPWQSWVYVADTKNKRIVRMKPDGTAPQVFSTGADVPAGAFGGPGYLAFGPDGTLYVSDNSRRIYAFNVGGA